ncbi:MAG: class I SAM-dependent methyltransferase, partial [Verrucomicrobiota bacterium]|nr:class I SAM-dependent methyltransferase [Verrucomicrobiota bacterium]
MSTAFADYAKYYAAFYQDKDYAREADYVLKTLRAHGYRGGPILELGCGQGGHAIPLAKQGCALFGLDRSEGMIAEADRRRGTLPAGDAARLK